MVWFLCPSSWTTIGSSIWARENKTGYDQFQALYYVSVSRILEVKELDKKAFCFVQMNDHLDFSWHGLPNFGRRIEDPVSHFNNKLNYCLEIFGLMHSSSCYEKSLVMTKHTVHYTPMQLQVPFIATENKITVATIIATTQGFWCCSISETRFYSTVCLSSNSSISFDLYFFLIGFNWTHRNV